MFYFFTKEGENNLKGLWIPYEILTNEHLSDKEKYIYSLILFFSKNDGYCTITNKYIATIVNLSDTRVSKLISSLSKKKYVQVITNFQDWIYVKFLDTFFENFFIFMRPLSSLYYILNLYWYK